MRIVSIAPVVPYDGIPHAGGQYYLRHLRALRADGHEVTLVAPDSAENRAARAVSSAASAVVLVPVTPPARGLSRGAAWFDRQQLRFFPARPLRRVRRAFARSARVRESVSATDVVEFQWTETGWLATRMPASARRIVIAHDVVLQNAERFLAASGPPWGPRALVSRARLITVRRDERRIYTAVDTVLVFSAKDAALVQRAAHGSAVVRVVRPPLAGSIEGETAAAPEGGTILFVGAFDRSVNADAALWTLREIVPRVQRRYPDARFVFAGANPTDEMRREAGRSPGTLTVTGRVDSLDEHYSVAALVLVPLRSGAGLKFKTVDAMVRGIPVVSTSIGVEGIVDDTLSVFAVADDAEGLADGICAALDDPAAARGQARAVQPAAAREFSVEHFRRTLADVYRPSPLES